MATAYGILCELAMDFERFSHEAAAEGAAALSSCGVKANLNARLLVDSRLDIPQSKKPFGLDPASVSRLSVALGEPVQPDP
jgi:hypothetical protein